MSSAGAPRRSVPTAAFSRRSWRCSPRPTIDCRDKDAESSASAARRPDASRERTSERDGESGHVVERQSSLDGGPFSPPAPSAAERSLSRERDREPDAARDALPLGLRDARDRPRSGAAEQIRACAGPRGSCRTAACSIFPANARRPRRSRRPKRPRANSSGSPCRRAPTTRARSAPSRRKTPRATSSGPRRSSTPPRTCGSRRRSRSPIRGSPTRSARPPSPGYVGLPIARIVEVHDRTLVFDEKFAPPVLVCAAHPTVEGWLDRVIGWIGDKLDELARYAADATAGGGLQSADYLMLQCLNREIPVAQAFPLVALRPSRAPV